MQTSAVLEGDEWVLNGEKWFSSSASGADIALVMAKTDPDAPRHERYSTFLVELPNPGYQILRNIETMQPHTDLGLKLGGSHSEIKIENLRVPRNNLLGGRGQGFNMGQHRLAYGRRPWHAQRGHGAAGARPAAAHVVKRETFGKRLADRQGVRWMLADCAAEIYKARLMLLHIAYKAEKGMDLRQENGIAKVFLANMVHQVGGHRHPAARRPRLQPGHPVGPLVHRHSLATASGRPGRGASLASRRPTSLRRSRSTAPRPRPAGGAVRVGRPDRCAARAATQATFDPRRAAE